MNPFTTFQSHTGHHVSLETLCKVGACDITDRDQAVSFHCRTITITIRWIASGGIPLCKEIKLPTSNKNSGDDVKKGLLAVTIARGFKKLFEVRLSILKRGCPEDTD